MIRAADRGDGPAIRALLNAVFPDNPKGRAAVLDWQYWDNPFGRTASWVAERDGEVVAHYAAFPIPGRVGGADAPLAMGADAATAESARGLGLFARLCRSAWDDVATRNGCDYVLAAPNPNSLPGAAKSGMVSLGDIPAHVRPSDDRWVAQRFHVPVAVAGALRKTVFATRARGPAATRVDGVPDGLGELWDEVGGAVANGTVASPAWWRWRYVDRPERPYRTYAVHDAGRLRGATIVTPRALAGARFLFVLELIAAGQEAASAVLAAALADPWPDEGDGPVVGAACVALPGSPLAVLARGAGMGRLPRRLEPRPLHLGVYPARAGLRDPATLTWSVSWGLLDHL